MIDIRDTGQLQAVLGKLAPDATPLWGKMSPQHIIEHLATVLQISTGKVASKFFNTQEEGDIIKRRVIHSDMQLVQGIKNPLLGDEPPPLRHADYGQALRELEQEIAHFSAYYRENPTAKHTQPRMGDLNHDEWLTLHNKHFTHHFKQYNLL